MIITDFLLPFAIFSIASFLLALILASLGRFISYAFGSVAGNDIEKISPYECGFNPFDESQRYKFDVSFYLIGILFLVFDLEVSFLFPWAISLTWVNFYGFFTLFIFLIILTIAFVYEWFSGSLDWI